MPAVLKLLGSPDHPSPDWIQVDVSNQFTEIAIGLAEDRLIPPLKQVTDLLVLSIVILTVTVSRPWSRD
jgi:hypothetical protein